MASLDALVEIAVYIGGGIAILAVLAHVLMPKPPMEGGGLPPISNAVTAGCGCGMK